MDLSEYARDPASAALIAAMITAGYIHLKARMIKEGPLKLNQYVKPALLNAIMVYFIISMGIGQQETISQEPF